MIYVLIVVALIVLAVVAIKQGWCGLDATFTTLAIAGTVLGLIIAGCSYYNMTWITVHYDEVAAVYGEAIDEYNSSVADMIATEGEVDNTTLTDFGQQGYPTILGKMIEDQRYVYVIYNKLLGKKQIYKNNILWSWLIFMPPERCVPIRIAG